MLYHETKLGKLYRGDCLEVMDKLIEEGVKVDAVITDPPYGTVKGLGDSDKVKHGMKNKTKWDEVIPIKPMFDKCERLLREGGVCILFGQDPYTSDLIKKQHSNLPFSYRNIWLKDHFANSLIAKKAPLNYYEDINVFFRKFDNYNENPLRKYSKILFEWIDVSKKDIFNLMGNQTSDHFMRIESPQFKLCTEKCYIDLIKLYGIDNTDWFKPYKELKIIQDKYKPTFNLWEGNKYKSNVFQFKKDYKNTHSTAKPILLIEDLIKTYSNEGDLILDFTSGSGTLAIAAENTNRKWICIEKDTDNEGNSLGYCDITVERLNKLK